MFFKGGEKIDITEKAKLLLIAMQETGQSYGLGTVVKVLNGSREKILVSKFGAAKLASMSSYGKVYITITFHCYIPFY